MKYDYMYGLPIFAPPYQFGWLIWSCGLFSKTYLTIKNWLLKNSGQSCDSDTNDKSNLEKNVSLENKIIR